MTGYDANKVQVAEFQHLITPDRGGQNETTKHLFRARRKSIAMP